MDLVQRPDLAQQQTLHLTAELRQGLAVLQLNALDLAEYVNASIEQNPVLIDASYMGESVAPTAVRADEAESDTPAGQVALSTADANRTVYSGMDARAMRVSTDALLEARGHGSPETFDAERRDMSQRTFSIDRYLETRESLTEHLMSQVRMQTEDERERAVAGFLVGNLDGNGYLALSVGEAAAMLGVPSSDVERVLAKVQRLNPIGVAARNLAECLRTQLEAQGAMTPLLDDLLASHLSDLEKKSAARVARDMGVDPAQLEAALESIRACDPRPGLPFHEAAEPIWPEATISRACGGGYAVKLNDMYLPELKVDEQYRTLAASVHDRAAAGYLKDKIREAEGLIDGIAYRRATLFKVACCIAEMQAEFFEEGMSRLRPLTMAQVADVVGVAPSTVSRIVNGNYVQTPRGTFEMRFFFHGAAQATGSVDVSALSVKQRIRELVDAEDAAHPLSDQAIACALEDDGVRISRRTVAKYRDQLGIPVRAARKRA